jgi:hypothetical protein
MKLFYISGIYLTEAASRWLLANDYVSASNNYMLAVDAIPRWMRDNLDYVRPHTFKILAPNLEAAIEQAETLHLFAPEIKEAGEDARLIALGAPMLPGFELVAA